MDDSAIYMLEKVGVNFEIIMERFSDNTAIYLSFVRKFCNDDTYSLFVQYIKNKDYEKAADKIHEIKGIAANLGFKNLCNISEEIFSCISKREWDYLDELLEILKKDYEDIRNIIV